MLVRLAKILFVFMLAQEAIAAENRFSELEDYVSKFTKPSEKVVLKIPVNMSLTIIKI